MTNIALVVLDTLRKDYFDEHFDWLPGTRFENAWSPSHWTVPVHASMFTGRYASEAGVYANSETFDYPESTLVELLNQKGYTTRAFSANGNISSYFDFDRGFDEFVESWRAEGWKEELSFKDKGNVFDWKKFNSESRHRYPARPLIGTVKSITGDYDTLLSLKHGLKRKLRGPGALSRDPGDYGSTEALNYIKETRFGENEFIFINLMEAHNPYNPPEEYRSVDPVRIHGLKATVDEPETEPRLIRQAYDDCVRYLSDRYKEIHRELAEDFDYVLTLSDHGELLGEHGSWEHLCGLQPELTKVPLTLHGLQDDDRDEVVNLLDVYSTILDLAGIKPTETSRGVSLRATPDDREYLSEYHGLSRLHLQSLDEEWLRKVSHMDTELNGLAAPESYYGYETFDGFRETGSSSITNPRERMQEIVGGLDKRRSKQEEYGDIEDELMDQLRDLGYA